MKRVAPDLITEIDPKVFVDWLFNMNECFAWYRKKSQNYLWKGQVEENAHVWCLYVVERIYRNHVLR